jgi:glycosyltransferase involved in cell wall biosynthesis
MISFIVPTYNEEKRLGDTLHMISHYKGAREIIVSDDNSNDGTVEIAKKYTDKIANISFLSMPTYALTMPMNFSKKR